MLSQILEAIKLLGRIKGKINKDTNGEDLPHWKITEKVLVHCNTASKDYKQDPRVLYTLVPDKSFDQFLHISLKYFVFLKTFDSEVSYIELWFTDQNSKPLQTEDHFVID